MNIGLIEYMPTLEIGLLDSSECGRTLSPHRVLKREMVHHIVSLKTQ